MKSIFEPNKIEKANLQAAAGVAEQIVEYAKVIHSRQFHGDPSPQLLPAIIEALATTYLATVHEAHK